MEYRFDRLPKMIVFLVLLLVLIGIIALYSAADGNFHPWASKQILLFCFSIPLVFIISLINVRTLYQLAYPAYFVSLLLLIAVEILGHTAMGATRWLEIASIKLQPSEPAKFAIILMLAKYFNDHSMQDLNQWTKLITPAVAVLIVTALIIKQPDLGTGLITIITSGMVFIGAGISARKILITLFSCLALAPIAWNFLYDYQKRRIENFLNPEADPFGSGYNIVQSKIAIGSGGFSGKGFLQGTQSHLSFLPEHQTDFIFAFLAEEFGFIGGVGIIILFAALIAAIINVSVNCRNIFLKLVTQGVANLIFCHVFINVAMVMGILPAVGVPLPFISYGGTMIVSMMIGIGLIVNANINSNLRL